MGLACAKAGRVMSDDASDNGPEPCMLRITAFQIKTKMCGIAFSERRPRSVADDAADDAVRVRDGIWGAGYCPLANTPAFWPRYLARALRGSIRAALCVLFREASHHLSCRVMRNNRIKGGHAWRSVVHSTGFF